MDHADTTADAEITERLHLLVEGVLGDAEYAFDLTDEAQGQEIAMRLEGAILRGEAWAQQYLRALLRREVASVLARLDPLNSSW